MSKMDFREKPAEGPGFESMPGVHVHLADRERKPVRMDKDTACRNCRLPIPAREASLHRISQHREQQPSRPLSWDSKAQMPVAMDTGN